MKYVYPLKIFSIINDKWPVPTEVMGDNPETTNQSTHGSSNIKSNLRVISAAQLLTSSAKSSKFLCFSASGILNDFCKSLR
jgi:hypothetical protein